MFWEKLFSWSFAAVLPKVSVIPPAMHGHSSRSIVAGKQGSREVGDSAAATSKFLCRYEVGIEEDRAFRVCRRLIGPGGENMKHIVSEAGSGVKVRIRGR